MDLAKYYSKQAALEEEEIQNRANEKRQELTDIFSAMNLPKTDNPRIAILGCADKRYLSLHKKMFQEIFKRRVEIVTFDIDIDHLSSGHETNIFKHDCTLPLPMGPYDLVYSHVLLKFVETNKQFDVIINSYNALACGGVAIHIIDNEELKSGDDKLPSGLWSVSVERLTKDLVLRNISIKLVPLKFGVGLIITK